MPAGRPTSKFGFRHWPPVLRDVVFLHSPDVGAVLLNLGCDTGHLSFEMSCSFTVQVQAQLVLLWKFVEDQGLQERCPALAKRSRRESGENCTFQHSMRNYRQFEEQTAFQARRPTVLRDRGLLPESSRTRGARWATVLRHRGFLPESSRTRGPINSKWKSRAQVAESFLKVRRADCVTNAPVPQGTTASTTPPFVRAGYDCQNNATPSRRPEAVGWAPLVRSGTTDYLLRDCGSVGTPAPGNGGTNEGAATQKPTVRHKGAATQKSTSERRNSQSNLGSRGGDPRTLAS